MMYIDSMATTRRTDKPIMNFVIEPNLLKRIDDYRFKHRFPSRSMAVKWLLDFALRHNPKPQAERGK